MRNLGNSEIMIMMGSKNIDICVPLSAENKRMIKLFAKWAWDHRDPKSNNNLWGKIQK